MSMGYQEIRAGHKLIAKIDLDRLLLQTKDRKDGSVHVADLRPLLEEAGLKLVRDSSGNRQAGS